MIDPTLELSLCLIVRDEEAYLRRCVESFASIFDELVIVDTGSTDRTEEIARDLLRRREGRLERFVWVDDFAAARNFACSLCRAPWILMVDADEFLAPDVPPRAVLDAIRAAPPHLKNLLLLDRTLDGAAVALVHPVNRLFRNDPSVRWTGRIHETLTVEQHEQALTRLALVHETSRKRKGPRLTARASTMYEAGLRADLAAEPANPRHAFYLGNTLAEREEFAGALEAYDRYLALAAGPQADREERWHALLASAWCRRRLGDPTGARRTLLEAVGLHPVRGETYLALGDLALEADALEEARHWFQVACATPEPTRSLFLDAHAYGARPWWRLGTALVRLADLPSARVATLKALEGAPDDPEVQERLVQLELALGQAPPPTVVIPSRTPDLVAGCLEALLATEGDVYFETLVVCDGGTAPFEPLLERFPRLRLVPAARPFVFARSANVGIAACEGDVVLLNDDARPETPGWLDALRALARGRPDAGPVAPLLTRTGNSAQDLCVRDDRHEALEATVVTYACVYLTRELLARVGPLDEGFVWYGFEDNDHCGRCAAIGRRPLVAQRVVVRHDEPSSSFRSPLQSKRMGQAQRYLAAKWRTTPAPRDLLVVVRGDGPRALAALERLLKATPEPARLCVVAAEPDEALAEGLRDLDDPRLSLRLAPGPVATGQLLDELAASQAQVVVEVSPRALLPEGWLTALERGVLATEEVGVVALPFAGARAGAPLRAGGVELQPVKDPAELEGAAAWLVARAALVELGPQAGAGSPWVRIAGRLARRRRVSGYTVGVRPADLLPGTPGGVP